MRWISKRQLFVIMFLAAVFSGSPPLNNQTLLTSAWWSRWLLISSFEIVQMTVIVIVFKQWMARNAASPSIRLSRIERSRRRQLLTRMGSKDNTTARHAIAELRRLGWLMDGSLHAAPLQHANLQQADLTGAHLTNGVFVSANLRQAKLMHTNLQGADLRGADLRGANLTGAILYGADLTGSMADTSTLMPDGTHWSPHSDLPHTSGKAQPSNGVIGPAAMNTLFHSHFPQARYQQQNPVRRDHINGNGSNDRRYADVAQDLAKWF